MIDRDYEEEYRKYHSRPEQIANRAARNAARAKMVAAGKVKAGHDVHHKNGNPRDNSIANLASVPKSKNRSMK